MTESNNSGDKTISVAPRKPLSLKRSGVERDIVRQSFSHGRTNMVQVERKKRRVTPPAEAKAEAPPPRPCPAIGSDLRIDRLTRPGVAADLRRQRCPQSWSRRRWRSSIICVRSVMVSRFRLRPSVSPALPGQGSRVNPGTAAIQGGAKSWMGAEEGSIRSFPSAPLRNSSQHPPLYGRPSAPMGGPWVVLPTPVGAAVLVNRRATAVESVSPADWILTASRRTAGRGAPADHCLAGCARGPSEAVPPTKEAPKHP